MKILIVHNFYQQPGGENVVFRGERDLLLEEGHEVTTFERDNREIRGFKLLKKIGLIGSSVWARNSNRDLIKIISKKKPSIAHFHNTFPLISPSGYYVCRRREIPSIQTIHNYRLFCQKGSFFRVGRICLSCSGKKLSWPGIARRCYHGSFLQSAVVSTSNFIHRTAGTFENLIDGYISLTQFSKKLLIENGIPERKIFVKPNFVHPDPGAGVIKGEFGIFVGRLSEEKGIPTLLRALKEIPFVSIKIIGEGPLEFRIHELQRGEKARKLDFLGYKKHEVVMDLMQRARFLVFPSECYEGFPMAIAESFSCGTPVITSRLGSMAEIVEEGKTGLFFNPGDSGDLAEKIKWAWEHPSNIKEMGKEARFEFEKKYTGKKNYSILMGIYKKVLQNHENN